MPNVSCPTCGERGKIPSNLIGVRIKCKKCGLSFLVTPESTKETSSSGPATGAGAASLAKGPSAAVDAHGIEVEGLDASAWSLPNDVAMNLKPPGDAGSPATQSVAASSTTASIAPAPPGTCEYKILSARDKIFEGRFDLARLEEVLNQLARQGWVAKSMLTPHLKGFTGALEETIIVLLERCKPPE